MPSIKQTTTTPKPPAKRASRRRSRLQGIGAVTALVPVLLASPAVAQQPGSPLLRGGQLSFFHQSVVSIYDERFGYSDGDDRIEPLGIDFNMDALGAAVFPGLASTQQRLADLAADSAFAMNMGASSARLASIVYRVPLGVSLGVFDWLTVGATFPLVKRRTDVDVALRDGNANVGLSPGVDEPLLLGFMAEAQTAIASVLSMVDATCMSLGDTDPACVDGRTFLTDAASFVAEIQSAYDGPVFFLGSSPAAALLNARVDAWRADLRLRGDSLLVDSTFVSGLPFASERIGMDEYQRFVSGSQYDVAGAQLEDFASIWELGDVEIWGALRLLASEHDPALWAPPEPSGAAAPDPDSIASGDLEDRSAADGPDGPGLGYLLGVQGLYRLGTGVQDLPGNFIDIGSGDGQDDIEVRIFGRVDVGRRIRARMDVVYGIQQEGSQVRRLSPVDMPFASIDTEGLRPWDPGDYLDIRFAPEIRLTPELTIGARYRRFHRDPDRWDFGDQSALPPDQRPSLLNDETEQDVRYIGFGVTLWPTAETRALGDWPIALSAEYLRASSGSGGQTPKDSRFRLTGRLFFELW